MSGHSADAIIRVANAGAAGIVIGGQLSADACIRIIQSTSSQVRVHAGGRSADSLVRIVQAAPKRVTIDFGDYAE